MKLAGTRLVFDGTLEIVYAAYLGLTYLATAY